MNQHARLRFIANRSEPIRQLPGFQKHHRVPSGQSESDLRFLYTLAEPIIDDDLQTTFGALRKAYGLKRKEISVDGPIDGVGTISLPFFEYRIDVGFERDDASRALITRTIHKISEPARIIAPPFSEAIRYPFSKLQLITEEPLDLESIIDSIEDAELENVEIEYDKDLTWCELFLPDSAARIRITPQSIETSMARDSTPAELMESFAHVQEFIAQLELIPFAFDDSSSH